MIKNAVIEEKTLNDSGAKDCISGIMCNKASIESEGNTVFESFTMPRSLTRDQGANPVKSCKIKCTCKRSIPFILTLVSAEKKKSR